MQISNSHELYVFFLSMLGGAIIGLIFDAFRIMRRNFKMGTAIVCISDIVFWIIISFVIYATIFISNSAVLRWYEFVAIGLGFIIYALTLSPIILIVSGFIISTLKKIIMFILKILFYPFWLIIKLLKRPAWFAKNKVTYAHKSFKRKRKSVKNRCLKNLSRFKRDFKKV